MMTYARFIHEKPLPTGGTLIPKPRRKVAVDPKAVEKATRTHKPYMPEKPPPNVRLVKLQQERIALFSPLKGKGQMCIADIAEYLGIKIASAKNKIIHLIEDGYVQRTKLESNVVFEWIA